MQTLCVHIDVYRHALGNPSPSPSCVAPEPFNTRANDYPSNQNIPHGIKSPKQKYSTCPSRFWRFVDPSSSAPTACYELARRPGGVPRPQPPRTHPATRSWCVCVKAGGGEVVAGAVCLCETGRDKERESESDRERERERKRERERERERERARAPHLLYSICMKHMICYPSSYT